MQSGERIPASRAADPRAWVAEHGDYLYRYALAAVRHREAAEDLVQDTLLAAWQARADFAGRATERTWLTAILKRKAVDWLRRRVRERLQSDGGEADACAAALFRGRGVWREPPGRWARSDPAGPAEREEFWAVLHGCLRKLPTRLHDAFTLRYLDRAAGEEVCRELGLSASNLYVMLHRARLRMWHCLSRNWFGADPTRGGEAGA